MMKSNYSLKGCGNYKDCKNLMEDQIYRYKEKTTDCYSSVKLVCDTCKTEIKEEISRVVLMRDRDGGPRLLSFHFFFPCWDFENLVQRYPNLRLDHAGFSVPESIKMDQSSITDLQNNLKMWYYPQEVM